MVSVSVSVSVSWVQVSVSVSVSWVEVSVSVSVSWVEVSVSPDSGLGLETEIEISSKQCTSKKCRPTGQRPAASKQQQGCCRHKFVIFNPYHIVNFLIEIG